jgi:hypothetical protein
MVLTFCLRVTVQRKRQAGSRCVLSQRRGQSRHSTFTRVHNLTTRCRCPGSASTWRAGAMCCRATWPSTSRPRCCATSASPRPRPAGGAACTGRMSWSACWPGTTSASSPRCGRARRAPDFGAANSGLAAACKHALADPAKGSKSVLSAWQLNDGMVLSAWRFGNPAFWYRAPGNRRLSSSIDTKTLQDSRC